MYLQPLGLSLLAFLLRLLTYCKILFVPSRISMEEYSQKREIGICTFYLKVTYRSNPNLCGQQKYVNAIRLVNQLFGIG